MSRLGITFEQVELAAEKLLAEGQNPTIERVRRMLGETGSNSTISKHLAEWKASRLMATRTDLPAAHIPPDTVNAAVNRVWQQLREESQAEIKRIHDELQGEIDKLTETLRYTDEKSQNLTHQLETKQEELNAVITEKELLSLDLKESNKEKAVLTERAGQLKERLTKEEHQLREDRHTFTVSLEEIKRTSNEKIEEMQEKYEEKIKKLQEGQQRDTEKHLNDIDRLKTELKEVNDNCKGLQEKYNQQLKLTTELSQENKILKANQTEMTKEKTVHLDSIKQELKKLETFDVIMNQLTLLQQSENNNHQHLHQIITEIASDKKTFHKNLECIQEKLEKKLNEIVAQFKLPKSKKLLETA